MTIRKVLAAAAVGAAFLAVSAVPTASAAQARVIIRPYYSYAPYHPYYRYGFYGPRWYYPGASVPAAPPTGDVKIETHMKGGSIYVDGGYAGETTKLKKFPLRPGNHDIEVRDRSGNTFYRERVQVLAGKTTDIKLAA